MRTYICIDIGGTSIKHGVLQENLEFLEKGSCATPKTGGNKILEQVCEAAGAYLEKYPDICGICVSSAGMIDEETGTVTEANEALMPGYTGTKIAETLSGRFQLPCKVDNDVNCAALAEAMAGAGKSCGSSLMLTVGTGIGGAFVQNGKVLKGHTNSACEIGYMHIGESTFEELAATSSLVKKVADELKLTADEIDGKWIFEQIAQGNEVCKKAVDEMCETLALGISNVCYVLNPEMVIIGGGISAQKEYLLPRLEKAMDRYLIPAIRKHTRMEFAACQNDAGMLGAYFHYLC